MEKDNLEELYISYFFPPDYNVSGINVLKRIIENNKHVDVIHNKSNLSCNLDIIKNHIEIDVKGNIDWWCFISEFIKKGINAIKKDYKKIYSRSWLMANHFLAAEYKLKSPDCIWSAEFSDPLIYNIENKTKNYKEMIVNDKSYIDKINKAIVYYNKKHQTSFDLIKYDSSAYFIAEYLVYLFADKIIFTNQNQCRVMLNQFPIDIKEHIINKIEIRPHTTLPDKYYYLRDINLNLNRDYINIACFGNDYYALRHFESLFYAIDSLNHKFKNKIRIYLYINDEKLIKNLIKTLNSSDLFIIKKPLKYFEFLNATTQFDVLIVNDLITKDNFDKNPYLPSKLSDYLGSSTDIWAFYEKESTLSKYNLKYKSDIHNLNSCRLEFIKILGNYGYIDDEYSFDDDYLFKRLTNLNILYENEYRRKINKNQKHSMLKNPFKKWRK